MEEIKKLIEVLSVENYQKIVNRIPKLQKEEPDLERKILELLQKCEMHPHYYIFFFSLMYIL